MIRHAPTRDFRRLPTPLSGAGMRGSSGSSASCSNRRIMPFFVGRSSRSGSRWARWESRIWYFTDRTLPNYLMAPRRDPGAPLPRRRRSRRRSSQWTRPTTRRCTRRFTAGRRRRLQHRDGLILSPAQPRSSRLPLLLSCGSAPSLYPWPVYSKLRSACASSS